MVLANKFPALDTRQYVIYEPAAPLLSDLEFQYSLLLSCGKDNLRKPKHGKLRSRACLVLRVSITMISLHASLSPEIVDDHESRLFL